MAIPKKNLLEAFQASAAAEKAKVPAPDELTGSKAGGPFAPQPASTPPPPVRAAPSVERAAWRPDVLQRLIALQVVITIAAFFLGRASTGGVSAAEEQGPALANESVLPAASQPQPVQPKPVAQTSSAAGTDAERALLDPRNRYTVKLVEYTKGRDDTLALATLQYLQSQGLPAAAKYQGSQLFILLGAAESVSALDGLLARAKTLNGPPPLNKPAEFHDAYVANIDRLLTR